MATRNRHEPGHPSGSGSGYGDSRGPRPHGGGRDPAPREEAGAAPRPDGHSARARSWRERSPVSGLHVRRFGDERAPGVVCLHGVTSWGGRFEELAARLAPGRHVVAPDLRGHGDSGREPPWRITNHLAHLEAALGEGPPSWLGHSFGGRLAFEWAVAHPGAVERLVLLDPAIFVPPHVALLAAENARRERRYPSFEDAIDRRFGEPAPPRAAGARRARAPATTSSRRAARGGTATPRRRSSPRTGRWRRCRRHSPRSGYRRYSCSASAPTSRTTISSTHTAPHSATPPGGRRPGRALGAVGALDETAAAVAAFLASPA